ncbi:MAG: GNAT family N-acetyltransferase [Myxococcota bacterium]|nr:GNAT family N-acetyltransferase [Myxococcota bacterium]
MRLPSTLSLSDFTPSQIAALIHQKRSAAGKSGMRVACILAGSRSWCHELVVDVISKLNGRCLLLSDHDWTIPDLPNLKANQPSVVLGTEVDCLVIDCMEGLDPDLIGAASGTVVGGGVMIFLRPAWANHRTGPKLARRLTTDEKAIARVGQRYTTRFWTRLAACSNALVWDEMMGEVAELNLPDLSEQSWSNECPSEIKPARTPDQASAIEKIVKALDGRKNRPLVLSSDRGRGKTAALGLAVAQSIQTRRKTGVVISPTRRSINPLVQQILDQCDGSKVEENTLCFGDSVLTLLTPAECAKSLPKADFAIVDEAAALPVEILKSVLECYNRTVFSTTEHGYEGTGRGFSIRFTEHLDANRPNWRKCELRQPIRWSEHDPLETALLDALGLSRSQTKTHTKTSMSTDFKCVRLDPLDKTFDTRIDAIFKLLIDAHYRTTPMDLARLYDSPETHIWTLELAGQLIGVVVMSAEGGLSPELASDITRGRRRLRGHLVPQTLANHCGFEHAPLDTFWRIVRIAIDAPHRRRGAGRYLLNRVAAAAHASGIDYLGTSFGVTAELVEFWSTCGFEPVRLGTNRGRSSGLFSMICVKAITAKSESNWHRDAIERFNAGLPSMLIGPLHSLEASVVLALLRRIKIKPELTPYEWSEIEAFGRGERVYEAVYDLLHKFAFLVIESTCRPDETPSARGRVWVEAVLKGKQPRFDVSHRGARSRSELVDTLISDTKFILKLQ